MWAWNEEIVFGSSRGIRDGSWYSLASNLAASTRGLMGPTNEGYDMGFRVASLVPEPGTGLLVMTGVLGMALRRKRTAKAL